MADTFVKLYVHIIFHTKSSDITIRHSDMERVFAYTGGIIRKIGGAPVQIGGMPDHVHILAAIPKAISLSDLVRTVKKETSVWMKKLDDYYKHFSWQTGYGAFSVSPSLVNKTIAYIGGQEEHHRVRSFEEEYRMFLEAYKIEYDERYVSNY